MDRYILVSYELQGKEGKILVREGTTEEEIKQICVIDRLEKVNTELLSTKVRIVKEK